MAKNVPIKFAAPDVGNAEIRRIKEVVKSGWLTKGPVVREFELRIARESNCQWAVAFDSCTAAMEMTLRALGIGPGDEVITTPYTYTATAEVIRNVGATIVFVDLDGISFEMDYERMADSITDRTKAVMPVDIGGKLCDYEAIRKALWSKEHIFKPKNSIQEALGRPAIIADAAHSFGAFECPACDYKEYYVSGEFADFTCFSFHVLKNITTGGEGGAVVWNDFGADNAQIEESLRLLGDHGQTSRNKENGWEYDIARFGFNHIMTNIDAAMGLAQLDRLEEIVMKRMKVTQLYDELFYLNGIRPLIQHTGKTKHGDSYVSAFHLYPVEIETPNGGDSLRNNVYWRMKEKWIPCNVHYKPLPMFTAYKRAGFDIKDYPNAFDMFCKVLTIPYHTMLTENQQIYIADTLRECVDRG